MSNKTNKAETWVTLPSLFSLLLTTAVAQRFGIETMRKSRVRHLVEPIWETGFSELVVFW